MASWELELELDTQAEVPMFVRIARAISNDIARGRLRPGAALPGSRTLAKSVGVHRNTVLAALRELESEGWIATTPARGTFVREVFPERAPRGFAAQRAGLPDRPAFDVALSAFEDEFDWPRDCLRMGGGAPDLRLAPVDALARAYRRVLKRHARQLLDYGPVHGEPHLRGALAEMLSVRRGLAARPEHVLVTRGSQMAVDLIARALIRPGDVVAVESFGYRPAWGALELAGAKLVPLPVDADGLDIDALTALTRRQRVRAVYVTPHHQYPTTRVLSPARRLELLALARRERLAVLEDDYDHEFHYDGRPILPLASADHHGSVVYIGTLSKLLAPGLRLGFVVAPTPLVEGLASIRARADRQGDLAIERAVAELIEDGELQRHARKVRRAYETRRAALGEALQRELAGVLDYELPSGGMALWAHVPEVDVLAWHRRAVERKVAFSPGARFAFDRSGPVPYVRIGFAAVSEPELREGVRRMVAALPVSRTRRR